jgi:hypothetical protein
MNAGKRMVKELGESGVNAGLREVVTVAVDSCVPIWDGGVLHVGDTCSGSARDTTCPLGGARRPRQSSSVAVHTDVG